MQTEKMMILKMLEEGKINAEDASRLLSSTDGSGGGSSHAPPPRPMPARPVPPGYDPQRPHGHAPPPAPSPHGYGASHGDPRSNAPHESGTDSMGRKFSEFVKEMEPKVKKFAGTVVEGTAKAAESISKSLSGGSKPAPSHYGAPAPQPHAPPSSAPRPSTGGIEEVVEIKVTEHGGELNLAGLNGQVLVKGYNGDKISAKIYTVAKRPGAKASLATLGNKYYLSYDENDFERVCIDAFVPEGMFSTIKAATVNGDLSISTVSGEHVFVENIGGNTEVVGVNAYNLVIESNNGNLMLKDTQAIRAQAENFNGPISINKIDIAELKATTFNGAIDMQVAAFAAYDHYKWNVETSNGKLLVVLPTYATLGYHIKAHAALDTVKLGLVGMNYLRNDRSYLEAQSVNYDTCLKKVDMELATSNAPLVIN